MTGIPPAHTTRASAVRTAILAFIETARWPPYADEVRGAVRRATGSARGYYEQMWRLLRDGLIRERTDGTWELARNAVVSAPSATYAGWRPATTDAARALRLVFTDEEVEA